MNYKEVLNRIDMLDNILYTFKWDVVEIDDNQERNHLLYMMEKEINELRESLDVYEKLIEGEIEKEGDC